MRHAKQQLFTLQTLVPLLVIEAWLYGTLYLPASLVHTTFSTVFLATFPGYFLYRAIAGYTPRQAASRLLGYSLGLSLISLMVIGLAVNIVLPLLGQAQPLTTSNLTLAIAGMSAGLVLATAVFRKRPAMRPSFSLYVTRLASIKASVAFFLLGLLVLPLLAVGGATMLNNGGSNWLALLVMGCCAMAFLVLTWSHKSQYTWLYPTALFSICASILLGTSMRGWNITGHDVMQEFQVFQLTIQHSLWNMQFYQDAYRACLSITILPTIFQRLTGIPDSYVFKLLFQLFFAMIAPIIYTSFRDFTSRKTALLAVFVFISFPTFLTDIMMLNRQEIALLCLALAILVGLDKQLAKHSRVLLALIFLAGMVLSHYSTSYIAASTLVAVVGIGLLLKLCRPLMRRVRFMQKPHFTLFHPWIVLATVVMIVAWTGLYTHTGGNISQTIAGISNAIPKLLHLQATPAAAQQPSSDAFTNYVTALERLRPFPQGDYYPTAIVARNNAHSVEPVNPSLTPPLQLMRVPSTLVTAVYTILRQAYVGIVMVMLGLGLLLALFKAIHKDIPNQYVLIGISSILIIGIQLVLPSDAVNYGITRVIQQGLVVLALPIVGGSMWLLGKLRITNIWQPRVLGVGFVLFFLVLGGFLPALTGGFRPVLALSNSGFYYEAYYTHEAEIAADRWLATQTPKGSRIYADEFARRKMITYATIFARPTLAPPLIPVDSYVYLSYGNTKFNEVPAYSSGNLIYYNVPYGFLQANKNLLYNSGVVQIYK